MWVATVMLMSKLLFLMVSSAGVQEVLAECNGPFNLGNWIERLQPREYTLRATGWVKFMSGLQSIISVYLLALGVWTYFGRPFE